MALYEITFPDGAVYEIEGPEGSSEADLINAVSAHTATSTSEIPTRRYHQPPQWAYENPNAYNLAQTALEYGGPAVEALGGIGGGMMGSAAGPAGGVIGASLGYGAAKGLTRAADVALGNVPPVTVEQGLTRAASDVGEGALYEMGGQIVAPLAVKGLTRAGGNIADLIKGRRADTRAAQIARKTISPNVATNPEFVGPIPDAYGQIGEVLRNAPSGMTPAEALARANINQPVLQTMLSRATENHDVGGAKFFSDMIKDQDAQAKNALIQMAGGETQAAVRGTREESINALNRSTTPAREQALSAANATTRAMTNLERQAMANRAAAAQNTDMTRRMGAFIERAPTIELPPSGEVVGNVRTPYRYTLPSEMATKAEGVATSAAEKSLTAGSVARTQEAVLQRLRDRGLQPLNISVITNPIQKMRQDLGTMPGNDKLDQVLSKVVDDLTKWSDEGGIIDAEALDSIRRNSVNTAIKDVMGHADKKMEAMVVGKLRPMIIDAVETAGGKGYRKYLEDYASEMQALNRKQLAAEALNMFDETPDKFIRLARNDEPELVEDILGAGKYNLVEELGSDAAKTIQDIGARLAARKEATGQALSEGARESYRDVLKTTLSFPRVPNFLSPKATLTNEAIKALEKQHGRKIITRLAEAAKTPQGLAELLETLPTREQSAIIKTINRYATKVAKPGVATSIRSTVDTINKLRDMSDRENQNRLAPR